eukprot:Gb_21984 [translate_table: standard]
MLPRIETMLLASGGDLFFTVSISYTLGYPSHEPEAVSQSPKARRMHAYPSPKRPQTVMLWSEGFLFSGQKVTVPSHYICHCSIDCSLTQLFYLPPPQGVHGYSNLSPTNWLPGFMDAGAGSVYNNDSDPKYNPKNPNWVRVASSGTRFEYPVQEPMWVVMGFLALTCGPQILHDRDEVVSMMGKSTVRAQSKARRIFISCNLDIADRKATAMTFPILQRKSGSQRLASLFQFEENLLDKLSSIKAPGQSPACTSKRGSTQVDPCCYFEVLLYHPKKICNHGISWHVLLTTTSSPAIQDTGNLQPGLVRT